MDEYLHLPDLPRSTEADVQAAARVVAGHAKDAGDLRMLLERLGIPISQPEPEPQLPRLPCSYPTWQDFRNGRRGPRYPPRCRRCGSVFKDWHRCCIPP